LRLPANYVLVAVSSRMTASGGNGFPRPFILQQPVPANSNQRLFVVPGR
jgi:hypothetical protein